MVAGERAKERPISEDPSPGAPRRRSGESASGGPGQERERRFRALYGRHARAVLAYTRRRCASAADADDALAETFLVTWRRFDQVPGDDHELLWLYGVARRVLANQRRGQRRRDQLADRLEGETTQSTPLEPEMADDLRAVLAAVARLSAPDREILLLAAWEGLSHAEIAVVLGCSENASAIRLHRARRRLSEISAKETSPRRTQRGQNGNRDAWRGRHG